MAITLLFEVGQRVRSKYPVPVHLHRGETLAVIVEGRVHEIDLQKATATFYHDAEPNWPNPFTLRWQELEAAA